MPHTNRNWEDELALLLYDFKKNGEPHHEKIYAFIRQLLSSRDTEILEMVRKEKDDCVASENPQKDGRTYSTKDFKIGWDAALSQLEAKIKE